MNPFSENPITTLTEWNALLASCTCCEMPSCPTPTKICESLSGTADAAYAPEDEPEIVDDEYYGLWAPFDDPGGDASAKLTTLYRKMDPDDRVIYVGEWGFWFQIPGYADPTPPHDFDLPVQFIKEKHVFDSEGNHTGTYYSVGHWYLDDGEGPYSASCSSSTQDISDTTTGEPQVGNFENVPFEACERTETTWTDTRSKMAWVEGVEETRSCPLTYGQEDPETYWADLSVIDRAIYELSDGITEGALIAAAKTDIPGTWPDPATGGSCSASSSSTWPTLGDIRTGDPAAWPGCDALPINTSAQATATKVRFRWEIPDTWEGSWFEIMWDIIEEPDGWDAMIDDPNVTPPDPLPEGWEHPQIPDPNAPARSWVSQDNSWEWTGPGTPGNAETWRSGWYGIDPPDVVGTRRVVNVRVRCYRGPFGSLPQKVGEQVEL